MKRYLHRHLAIIVSITVVLAVALLGSADAADAHAWFADDGCGPGPSSSGYFYAVGTEWATDTSSGYGGCHMYTANRYDPKHEWAEWYIPITGTNYNHTYDFWTTIDTWICGSFLMGDGHYHRWRNGHDGGITAHVWWDQNSSCSGAWTKLATGPLCSSPGGLWNVWDNTFVPANSHYVFVDVILFNPNTPTHSC